MPISPNWTMSIVRERRENIPTKNYREGQQSARRSSRSGVKLYQRDAASRPSVSERGGVLDRIQHVGYKGADAPRYFAVYGQSGRGTGACPRADFDGRADIAALPLPAGMSNARARPGLPPPWHGGGAIILYKCRHPLRLRTCSGAVGARFQHSRGCAGTRRPWLLPGACVPCLAHGTHGEAALSRTSHAPTARCSYVISSLRKHC